MLKNLGLSGFSLAGADVGGYAGTPSPELLTKWIEIAAFQPIDRDHAEKGTGDHEPWSGGPEQEAIRRRFIEERYKLLPYLYTVMEDGTHTGLPLLRPLFLEFPDATADRHPMDIDIPSSGEFMVGPDLLVAPPPSPDEPNDYDAQLPSSGWYDFWTGQRMNTAPSVQGNGADLPSNAVPPPAPAPATIRIHPELAALPVFVRPGAIIPIQPLVQSTSQQPEGPLTLRVFSGPQCEGAVYQDDGSSFAYKRGEFLRMRFTCELSPQTGSLAIHIAEHEGQLRRLVERDCGGRINGFATKSSSATVDGKRVETTPGDQKVTIFAPDHGFSALELVIHP